MAKYSTIGKEETLKVQVFADLFQKDGFCYKPDIDNIDFVVTGRDGGHLLWAEAKKNTADVAEMFVQLLLTIGKARTFNKYQPPRMLAAFDSGKIAFLPYGAIHEIFYQNDFNWNAAPSDHGTKEFRQIKGVVDETIGEKKLVFDFGKEDVLLKDFIKANFVRAGELFPELVIKIQIDRSNFVPTYMQWSEKVKPSIQIDWAIAKKNGIIDGDFYLADLLSRDNRTIKEKLFVLLKQDVYELGRHINDLGLWDSSSAQFNDGGRAHRDFWMRYERPPRREYWDYIIERRELLIAQDLRERKGSFFTPRVWVQKSQEYLAQAFGDDWQNVYYVWDCAAGTGNLLLGLTEKNRLWASTIDKQDVAVMHERIQNGAALWPSHVFQFDFLNGSFDNLPRELKRIIDDPAERRKLIVYINPPYAETMSKTGTDKTGLNQSMVNTFYKHLMGNSANRELFIQFLTRIYVEIPGCKIAEFSTLKMLNAPHFESIRSFFLARLEKFFVVPAYTFDNVSGKFPIGFKIWDTSIKEKITAVQAGVYDKDNVNIGVKQFACYDGIPSINDWITATRGCPGEKQLGFMSAKGIDFQNNNYVYIVNDKGQLPAPRGTWVTDQNLREVAIYFAVRHCFEQTWLNNRDQFYIPNDRYKTDTGFHNDCLIYTLFHGKNNIQSRRGVNHWIPFTEEETGAGDAFESHFMSGYLKERGLTAEFRRVRSAGDAETMTNPPRTSAETSAPSAVNPLSPEALAVLDAGREIWRYYHASAKAPLVNASFYDIREFFQGRKEGGAMNPGSKDERYTALIAALRNALKALTAKIQPKVREYGFLRG